MTAVLVMLHVSAAILSILMLCGAIIRGVQGSSNVRAWLVQGKYCLAVVAISGLVLLPMAGSVSTSCLVLGSYVVGYSALARLISRKFVTA